jgi:hypothetical protein
MSRKRQSGIRIPDVNERMLPRVLLIGDSIIGRCAQEGNLGES